jgi:hypothetical protein
VPGEGAIKGGPGNGPKPGAPLYVCRVNYSGAQYPALYPGKWVQGECHFSNDQQKEQTSKTYEVAYGTAEWRDFDGDVSALVPGGYDSDGTHLYICRKKISFFGDKGLQPGRLENGVCHIPYGNDLISNPPFEALYNVFPPGGPPQDQPAPSAAPTNASPAQPHGLLVSFASGTSATAGTITVTNGSTGTTVTKPLPPNSTLQQCLQILQQAAFQAGLQIQAQPDGDGLRVFGINNAVNVTQASASVTQF